MTEAPAPLIADGLVEADDVARFQAAVDRLRACQDLSPLLYATSTTTSDAAVDAATTAMAQTVATLITRLEQLADPQAQLSQTPRDALLALVDTLRHSLCLSLQHYANVPNPDSREGLIAAFNTYAAVRQVPIEAVVEGLHSVGYISAKLRIERAALQLQRRLEAEFHARGCLADDGTIIDPVVGAAATGERDDGEEDAEAALANDASTAALHVTYTLLDDFRQLYENTLRLLDAEGQTGEALLSSALREYYRLTDWILLAESATQVPAVSFTAIQKVEVDLTLGEATFSVRRATSDTPWGLLFNDKGRLIDVDVAMRGRKGARDLHQLLRCATEGARLVAINDEPLVSTEDADMDDGETVGDAVAAQRHKVLMALRAASQGTRKRMQVTIESPYFKQDQIMDSHVATFAIPFQGSEWAGGQSALLVMQRLRPNAPLPVQLDAALRVQPVAPLGGIAGPFLERLGDRVRVLAVNGVEVFSLEQAASLMRDADTVMLTLVLTYPSSVALISYAAAAVQPTVTMTPPAPVPALSHRSVATATQQRPPKYTVAEAEAEAEAEEEALQAAVDAELEATETVEPERIDNDEEGDAEASPQFEEVEETPLVALTTQAELVPLSSTAKAPKEKRRVGRPKRGEGSGGVTTEMNLVDSILREFANEETAAPAPAAVKAAKTTRKAVAKSDAMNEASLLESIAQEVAEETGEAAPAKKTKRGTSKDKKASAAATTTPCTFANGVTVVELTNKAIVLERPSTTQPWGIEGEMATHSTDFPGATGFRITKLPAKPLVADHPFLHKFEAAPPTWYVSGVNQLSAKGKTGQFVVDKMRQLKRMTLHIIHK